MAGDKRSVRVGWVVALVLAVGLGAAGFVVGERDGRQKADTASAISTPNAVASDLSDCKAYYPVSPQLETCMQSKGYGLVSGRWTQAPSAADNVMPTSTPRTTASASFVLTPQTFEAELEVLKGDLQDGGHIAADGTVYDGILGVQGVLCKDGFFDLKIAGGSYWTPGGACAGHDDHVTLKGAISGQLPASGDGILGTICNDGTISSSTGSGTCSHHGGERK